MARNEMYPRLCGGVFFELLLQARKPRMKARETYSGKSDGLSEPNCLAAFISVFYPEYPTPPAESFKTDTSSYKKCLKPKGSYLPFDDTSVIEAFDAEIRENYEEPLKRMGDFIMRFIDTDKKYLPLYKRIVSLIAADESIGDEEQFYVSAGGKPISKNLIVKNRTMFLQPFLLGVLHYIITKRPDTSIGADTYVSISNKSAVWMNVEYYKSIAGTYRREIIPLPLTDEIRPEKMPVAGTKAEAALPQSIGNYEHYLCNVQDKYSIIKTLLYSEEPHTFYTFYVCNNVIQRAVVASDGKVVPAPRRIEHISLEEILNCSHFVMLTGTGGLGKSMMMRHLLLDTAMNYGKYHRIPIFVALKDYGRDDNLMKFIYEKCHALDHELSYENFEKDFEEGHFLLLLDGLDEIGTAFRAQFESKLDSLTDTYRKNVYVVSSRPYSQFVYLSRFSVMRLQTFNKEQSLELIDKLDFRPDAPAIKDKFRKELNERLFHSHQDFATNPLLLTIMLMTYEQYAEVPSKMHIFYHEAYATLSQKHDASKGAYKRALRTGLTADRFEVYFAEFCAKTYIDEKFELSESEIDTYYHGLKAREEDSLQASTADFIFDLSSNMCLMYFENSSYQFTHRSFQEYFCALCFSRWQDRKLNYVGQFFEKNGKRMYEDQTFVMLYDMIREKVEENILLPYLVRLFKDCDKKKGYRTFLEKIYPVIVYAEGEADGNNWIVPSSYLFDFIAHTINIGEKIQDVPIRLPFREDLIWVPYVRAEFFGLGKREMIVPKSVIDSEYVAMYGVPEIVGYTLRFKIEDVYNNPVKYAEIVTALENEDFPLKKEYRSVRAYLERLKRKKVPASRKLSDLF